MYLMKENNRCSECYEKNLYVGPKYFDKLKPLSAPKRGPTRQTALPLWASRFSCTEVYYSY